MLQKMVWQIKVEGNVQTEIKGKENFQTKAKVENKMSMRVIWHGIQCMLEYNDGNCKGGKSE